MSNLKVALVGSLGAAFLWLLRRSIQIEFIFPGDQPRDWTDDQPRVLAFWHRQQLMMPWIYLDAKQSSKRKPIAALISKSNDGRFIAKAMKILGIGSVAGSSSRGGREAMIQMVRLVKGGSHAAITPDGPKGPVYKVKFGALRISQLTGAKLYPAAFAAKDFWQMGSWDKMIVPKPFTKAIIMSGEPLFVPRDASDEELEKLAQQLENELNRVSSEAQLRVMSKWPATPLYESAVTRTQT